LARSPAWCPCGPWAFYFIINKLCVSVMMQKIHFVDLGSFPNHFFNSQSTKSAFHLVFNFLSLMNCEAVLSVMSGKIYIFVPHITLARHDCLAVKFLKFTNIHASTGIQTLNLEAISLAPQTTRVLRSTPLYES